MQISINAHALGVIGLNNGDNYLDGSGRIANFGRSTAVIAYDPNLNNYNIGFGALAKPFLTACRKAKPDHYALVNTDPPFASLFAGARIRTETDFLPSKRSYGEHALDDLLSPSALPLGGPIPVFNGRNLKIMSQIAEALAFGKDALHARMSFGWRTKVGEELTQPSLMLVDFGAYEPTGCHFMFLTTAMAVEPNEKPTPFEIPNVFLRSAAD